MWGDVCLPQPAYPSPELIVYPDRVPYRGGIPNGLHDGKMVEIKGSIPYGADVFEINFLTGYDPSSDRALHMSVRLNGRVVVLNSFEHNMWGFEERHTIFPFHSGREFKIMVLVDSTSYKIAVDNQHCWEFVHRIPTSRVSSIYVDGSVQIERIEFIDKNIPYCWPSVHTVDPGFYPPSVAVLPGRLRPGFPSIPTCPTPSYPGAYPTSGGCIIPPPEQIAVCPQPGYFPEPTSESSNLAPVYNPNIPYAYPIYGGIKPGMMVYISGRPSTSANRFTLNFQAGTAPYPPPDISFHFDVRFFNRTIVRNSRTNNAWEREESLISHFPFQPGVNFDLMIRIEGDRYMLALNGQHFLEFRHRLHPYSRFDTLYIENDIVVSSIRFG